MKVSKLWNGKSGNDEWSFHLHIISKIYVPKDVSSLNKCNPVQSKLSFVEYIKDFVMKCKFVYDFMMSCTFCWQSATQYLHMNFLPATALFHLHGSWDGVQGHQPVHRQLLSRWPQGMLIGLLILCLQIIFQSIQIQNDSACMASITCAGPSKLMQASVNYVKSWSSVNQFISACHGCQGPVLLTFLRHVARISANGIAAFKESCSPIG